MVMLRVGSNVCSAEIKEYEEIIELRFGFNSVIKDEVKVMDGARWNPASKAWTVKNNQRNRFALDFLKGVNVFAEYDQDLVPATPNRKEVYHHQRMMIAHGLQRHYCVIAGEMGTGKTLALIEIMEQSGNKDWWYIGPKSALLSVRLDFMKWNAKIIPEFMTYEKLVDLVKKWPKGKSPPRGLAVDESSKCKNPSTQRSQAVQHVSDAIRAEFGKEGYVIEMTGSPAPKEPTDWWSQAEIARPGFLREGNIHKFRDRLAIVKQEETQSGVKYPKVLGFKDSVDRCAVCAKMKDHEIHTVDPFEKLSGNSDGFHDFVPCKDEITLLNKRLQGLAYIILKKDCLDLPEKVLQRVKLEPSKRTLQLAKAIKSASRTAATALINLRALSDGFQYHDKEVGVTRCKHCNGEKTCIIDGQTIDCIECSGKGYNPKIESHAVHVETPKDQFMIDFMNDKEDGRLVTFAGFTASIEKNCELAIKTGWNFICVDGRGWRSNIPGLSDLELLKLFQSDTREKINFIGHPGSAGMGLTLTASDTIIYYSNDFNGESRVQSMDRIHRPGCRGANIIDLIHLPVDEFVINRLDYKLDLQKITMGDIPDE